MLSLTSILSSFNFENFSIFKTQIGNPTYTELNKKITNFCVNLMDPLFNRFKNAINNHLRINALESIFDNLVVHRPTAAETFEIVNIREKERERKEARSKTGQKER